MLKTDQVYTSKNEINLTNLGKTIQRKKIVTSKKDYDRMPWRIELVMCDLCNCGIQHRNISKHKKTFKHISKVNVLAK